MRERIHYHVQTKKKFADLTTRVSLVQNLLTTKEIPASVGAKLLVNILAARNRESGNLEIGVPVLGNRLFCA